MKLFAKIRRKPWTLDKGVTDKTKFYEIAPFIEFLKESTTKELKRAAEAKYGDTWGITLGQFIEFSKGNFKSIGFDRERPDELTALQYFYIAAFKDMAEGFTKALEALRPPQTTEAEEAAKACKKMSFEESMLVFCRDYFGLHNFNDARSLQIADILLAKKDRYNHVAFEKARADIHERLQKAKKRL